MVFLRPTRCHAKPVIGAIGRTLDRTGAMAETTLRGAATVAGIIGEGLARGLAFMADLFSFGAAASEHPPSASKSGERLRPSGKRRRRYSGPCHPTRP